ncbi:MAG TPA: serine/threonine-protein kinase [Pyrinomonadaceae bacterium]|nr:serine/threonine-protein kinase [Pyrinomonadaceae bacterium]
MKPAPRRDPYRLIGELFGGRYRLEAFAGAGSFGAVYRATDERLGRTVAVKILKPDIEESNAAGARELFQREALTAGRLTHPHIVAVTDTGEEAGFAYLVMEWLEGRTLDDELRARTMLSPEETAPLLASISDALSAAHDAGIIHRDIKPSNIHLGRHGRYFVKVLDFGIAKVIKSSAAAASRIAGTLSYMSPEQLGGDAIDHRSDIYALGIMLHQMLAGTLPFDGETQGQIIQQHFVAQPPLLHTVRPDLPPALSHVIQRALSKRAEDRQQSTQQLFREFIEALQPASAARKTSAVAESQQRETQILQSTQEPIARPTATVSPVAGGSAYAPTVAAPIAPSTNQSGRETVAMVDRTAETLVQHGTFDGKQLVRVRKFAIVGAILLLLTSVGLSFLARSMGWSNTPYPYDEFVLETIPLAARDAIFGAFLGAAFSELFRKDGKWSIVTGQRARALIVHGAVGAALLMSPFVLLRTSLIMLPLTLALAGFALGLLVCGMRIGAQKVSTRL